MHDCILFLLTIWKYLPRDFLEINIIIILGIMYKIKKFRNNIYRWKRGKKMKTTGVVRRVDDLGRIVIPKEIRRTLRIRDGESLEIYVDDETISLKKYSSMNDLSDISKELVNTINQNLLKDAFISDHDKIVIGKNFAEVEFADGVKEKYSYIISPIIMNGDAIGSVVIFSDTEVVNEVDIKLVSIISSFLGKHIEE